jgi:TPR repeat protein
MLKIIIIFLNVFLTANYCLAAFNNDSDFRKYGFITNKNIIIDRAIWGYRLAYSQKSPNTYAFVLAKVPQTKNVFFGTDKISFNFKARLYPVAPKTQGMRRVIKAYVKTSLGKTKARKRKNGVICTPAFVVCMNESLSRSKTAQRSFPIQYSKSSAELPETDKKKGSVTLLFRDTRLLPLNLFSNYDVEVVFDYRNRIVSFNCNGNKVILKDSFMKVWKYFGLATLFSTVGYNRNTVIALEYEFSSIKICRNVNRLDSEEKQAVFPRLNCAYYQELIEQKKDIDAMYCLGMNYYEGTGGAEKDYYQAFKWFKKAAMDEHVFGQYYLGLCYLYGRGIEQDNLRAWKWLSRSSKYFYDKAQVLAAQCVIDKVKATNELNRAKLLQNFLGPAFFQGNANACFLQSYCAHYDIAGTEINYLEGFKDAARRGHPKAFYYLGMHFAKNKRTLKNAFKCYLESAELGFVPAFVKLGMCYHKGIGTKKDPKEALKWFKKAAYENNAEGIFRLACYYLLGQGVEKDRKKAVKLFNRAAEKSSPRALIALLFLQENNPLSPFFHGNDQAANDESSAKKNSSYLCRRAICLKYGIGTVKSVEKAHKFLRRSSKYNHWMTFELADSYEYSKNESRDFYKAIGLYKNAIAKGNIRASWRLAKFYLKLGNKIEAMLYYRQAAQKGHAAAAFELGKLLLKDSTSSSAAAQAKAFAFFKKAAENAYIQAYYELGDCYYKGQGVKKNTTRAAECWEKYETAFLKHQNNSLHGLYWKDLPYQRPVKYDKNGLPVKYQSQLKDKKEILNYYKKY